MDRGYQSWQFNDRRLYLPQLAYGNQQYAPPIRIDRTADFPSVELQDMTPTQPPPVQPTPFADIRRDAPNHSRSSSATPPSTYPWREWVILPIWLLVVPWLWVVWMVHLDISTRIQSRTMYIRQEIIECTKRYMRHLCYSPDSVPSIECEDWRRCMQASPEVAWTPALLELMTQCLNQVSNSISVSPAAILSFLCILISATILTSLHMWFNYLVNKREAGAKGSLFTVPPALRRTSSNNAFDQAAPISTWLGLVTPSSALALVSALALLYAVNKNAA